MFVADNLVEKTVAETDFGTAMSSLPAGYTGPCKVTAEGRTKTILVLPSAYDAEHAARFAVGELGGYHTARVTAAEPGDTVTHGSWDQWAFES